ncbi:MAG: carboxypeptidase regulatory-like domain-containing protein, partial [Candidatus Cloacimonetes bacterium]|nr:carboxypeptidase regulatory-like domain-containing protein [Candidatus Cloacimonadota bacterium]MCF7813320.1 carboxypeptidase regulatory-like domain-containing protein [Candidatus Cloacimonadota bacterium]MCF7867809.1 carboxypeptidase regulatory-like domain-containing protein [Candidatus Cloacimonadota bacterium]MCF7883305.1 carboxypeptidase regulatory-like domain-containing protein [Candidatus Cloacimonadota bacterium]
SGFVKDEVFYNNGSIFPEQIVQLGTPAILRGLRVVNLTINPFQYDPVKQELRIISNIQVAVHTTGFGGENEVTRSNFQLSRAFEPLYKATVLNYDEITSREDNFQDPSYLFIHTNDTSVEDALSYLVDWKHQKGFDVSTHGVNSGTSFNTIKSYIQTAYDTWQNPPEYVCFVGDAEGSYNIPTDYSGGYGGGDHGYARLDGTDILADVYLGRLSFNSITELQTIIYKILYYEKEPYMAQTDWYEEATMVGDVSSSSGTSTRDTKIHCEEMMLQHNPNYTFHEYFSGGYSSGMTNTINSGISYMNYRGYAGMSGFGNSNIQTLNNGFMMPVATFPTCGTGTFYSGTSRSEAFIRVGTPGQPRGAIAAYGTATLSTHTCFNNIVDAGTYYGLFADRIFNMGGALTRGKLALYLSYPNQPNYVANFSQWNTLMGDPGMEVWTGVPQELVVAYEPQLGIGANTISVNVQDANGQAVENAWVTALMGNDDIFATGYTDAAGNIVLEINAQEAGNANLTVTKHNYIPHLGSFDVGQLDRFVNIFDYQIDDDNNGTSTGNNDGVINPGETIELVVGLENFGTITASGITATISSNDAYITISDATEDYGDIASGVTVFSPDDFDFSVDADVTGGMEVHLTFTIEDNLGNTWYDYLSLPVEGASLVVTDYDLPGNTNGIWEPGETTNLSLTIENPGTVAANDVYGILSLDDDWFTINTNDVQFGTVNAGGQANNTTTPFEVMAASTVLPGSQFTGEVLLYNAAGYANSTSFMITVGEATITDPLGPDAYGYYCYDDGDVNYYNVPEYNWIDTSTGTQLSLSDPGETGDTDDITNLPITFKFYGVEYNSLTVSSNGWIAPGQSGSTSFMNWQIPGPQGPSPMIAPFWDDLVTGAGSSVKYLYDSAQNYFVITWENLKNEYNTNSLETFQVILYDANYYPTSTGDSEIKFQYQEFNNIDVGSYPSNHGQYCTVGLEDHTGLRGLEYTFNNQYPLQAKPLQDEMALLFTGPPIQFNEPFLTMGGLVLNDQNGNGQADYAETINLDVMINNIGQQSATNVSAVISASDPNITITTDNANYNTIQGSASGTNITPFVFDIAEDCPNGHVVPFTINLTSDQDEWELYFTVELNAPVIDYNSIFVDDGNNNILDPGETADMYVSFENSGGADAYNLLTILSEFDPYIELNSANYTFTSLNAGTIGTAEFNITADASAPVGHMASVDWAMNGDYNFSVNGMFQVVISQVPVLMEEDFSGTFPPTDWSTSGGGNWQQGTGNNAGGITPEAEFYWSPSALATQRLITMPMNTAGSAALDLEFKHYLNDFSGGGYQIKVQTTSDGTTWNDAWSITPTGDIGPEIIDIDVATPDVGSTTFQMAFVFDGDSWDLNWWNVDDVHLEGGQGAQLGFIQGTVTLDGGSGDVEDVIVSAGNYSTSPDEFGIYIIPIPAGTYDLTAELAGYTTGEENDVVVNAGLTTTIDFILSYLQAPQNLAADVMSNDVILNWEMPTENVSRNANPIHQRSQQSRNNLTDKKSSSATENSRDLTGFKIYRNNSMIAEVNNPSTMEYLDEFLPAGDHSYFVTAVYDDVTESESSNIVDVTIVLNVPTDLQADVIDDDVELSWTAPADNRSITGYRIYRNNNEIAVTTETTYTDEDLSLGSYTYFVKAEYGPYLSDPSNEVVVELTDAMNIIIPERTALLGNHPNPFNPETEISLALKENSFVTLEIYNIKGQKIRTLLNDEMPAGIHSLIWKGEDDAGKQAASGVYFYKMKAGNILQTKKMILMK